jgi:dTMP kinase
MRGKFITFEGGEGVGKSTQAKLLLERLAGRAIDAVLTREPGGSAFAEQLRQFMLDPATRPHGALTEALLFYAARADHLHETIRPALADGRWVVCDRFSDSTRVYQGAAGGVAPAALEALERLVVGADAPDLTLLLDLDPLDGLRRVGCRGATAGADADRFEGRDLDFHQRLRAGYLALAKADPVRCLIIDAALPPAAIARIVWQAVEQRLLAGAG